MSQGSLLEPGDEPEVAGIETALKKPSLLSNPRLAFQKPQLQVNWRACASRAGNWAMV